MHIIQIMLGIKYMTKNSKTTILQYNKACKLIKSTSLQKQQKLKER